MAGQNMRQFQQEIRAGIYGGNMSNNYAASVMRDQMTNQAGMYCTPRDPQADEAARQMLRDEVARHRAKVGMPALPEHAPAADNGQRVRRSDKVSDPVNQPAHYTAHPGGIQCIDVTEHMGFNIGNAVKYLWRCDLKNDAIEDLKKAAWYIAREIAKREKAAA